MNETPKVFNSVTTDSFTSSSWALAALVKSSSGRLGTSIVRGKLGIEELVIRIKARRGILKPGT